MVGDFAETCVERNIVSDAEKYNNQISQFW